MYIQHVLDFDLKSLQRSNILCFLQVFLFPLYLIGGEYKGSVIYEDATQEQLMNVALHFSPEEKVKFMPIFESSKFIELYQKMKK